MPLRRAGFLLPPWEDLKRISGWCRDNDVPLHFDGARLWEAAAGYGRTLRAVAALADSIYVSFYKGIGGLGGCVVAGSRDSIDALEVWRTRQGAALYTSYPYALSAIDGLKRHLPRMPDFVRRARLLAARLRDEKICQIHPLVPQTNAFQVIFPGAVAQLKRRNCDFAMREKVWLFNAFFESPFEGRVIAEIVIGDAADDYTDDEACGLAAPISGDARGRAAPGSRRWGCPENGGPAGAQGMSALSEPLGRWHGHADHRCSTDELAADSACDMLADRTFAGRRNHQDLNSVATAKSPSGGMACSPVSPVLRRKLCRCSHCRIPRPRPTP